MAAFCRIVSVDSWAKSRIGSERLRSGPPLPRESGFVRHHLDTFPNDPAHPRQFLLR